NRDAVNTRYGANLEKHFSATEQSGYWRSYVNWYELLTFHHGPNQSRWKETGNANLKLKELVEASNGWGFDKPPEQGYVDGSIITAGLFAVLSLDAYQSNDPTTDSDIGKVIGSSRFHDLSTPTADRPLVKLLKKLC